MPVWHDNLVSVKDKENIKFRSSRSSYSLKITFQSKSNCQSSLTFGDFKKGGLKNRPFSMN